MAYLTKEERAAKNKADRKKREERKKKMGSWFEKAGKSATGFVKDVPSKLKSMSEKQKAKTKADREKREEKKAKKATEDRARIAAQKKPKKARVAKEKTTKAKKKTFAERVSKTKAKTTKAKTTKPVVAKTPVAADKPVVAKTATKGDGFGAKFKEARSNYLSGKGPKTFSWDGKKYHTRWKGETPEQLLAKRKKTDVEAFQQQIARKYGGGKV